MTATRGARELGDPGWRRTSVEEFRLVRPRALRLAAVSLVALAVVYRLAAIEPAAGPAERAMIGAGWLLMPLALVLVARVPRFRTILVLPASLATVGVFLVAAQTLPSAGWLALSVGLAFGGMLGAWLWFGWAPAPGLRAQPRHPLRLALVAVHVAIVLAGLALLIAGAGGEALR